MAYRSGKVFTHSQGLSCCFRQWRAKNSHCRFLHGYSLQVELEFERQNGGTDERNWVMGFGDLKPIKQWLDETFDHKTLIAADDPDIKTFKFLHHDEVIQLQILDNVGMEAFAFEVYAATKTFLKKNNPGVKVLKSTVREHESNWASYSE